MYFWSIQNRRYQSRGVSWLLPLGEDSDRQRRQAVDALGSGSWQFLHDLECLFAAPDAARASRRARRGCSTHRWGCHEASDGCHRTIWTGQVLVVCMPASPLVRAALPRAVGNGKIWPRVRLHKRCSLRWRSGPIGKNRFLLQMPLRAKIIFCCRGRRGAL